MRAGQRRAAGDVVFADAHGCSEVAPQLRVGRVKVFLFGEIFHDCVPERAFGAGG